MSIQVKLQLTDLMVSLHDKSETLHDLLRNDVQAIRCEPKKTTNLYFSTMTIKRLPNPYNTLCRQSAEEECNFNFYTKLWLDNVGCLPDHYLYNSSQSSTFCGNTAIGEDGSLSVVRNLIVRKTTARRLVDPKFESPKINCPKFKSTKIYYPKIDFPKIHQAQKNENK